MLKNDNGKDYIEKLMKMKLYTFVTKQEEFDYQKELCEL